LLVAFLLRRYFVGYRKFPPGNVALIVINHAALLYISLQLLRMGNYLWAELWFFVALYVVTGKMSRMWSSRRKTGGGAGYGPDEGR